MVAVTIGLIVLAAVSTVFVNTGRAYKNQDRMARVQDNGRFAMHYLIRDIRQAGYSGCLRDLSTNLINNLNTTTGFFYGTTNFNVSIEGIEDVSATGTPAWYPSNDTTLPSTVWRTSQATTAKPDLLAIRLLDTSTIANVTDSPMTALTANPTVSDSSLFKKGDIVFLGDCIKVDVFQLSDAPASSKLPHAAGTGVSPGNSRSQLSKQYDTSARVYKFATRRYYIALNANQIPSLYSDDNNGTPMELVEGIETLQVLYGVTDAPPNGAPTAYYKANALSAADWQKVVSVKIGILARTPNNKDLDTDTNTYDVNGTTIGPFNDRNSRRVFVATVALKNKVLP
jgi:type IV pilus assembly protein PilW